MLLRAPLRANFGVPRLSRRDLRSQVCRVISDTEQNSRLPAVQPRHSEEVETVIAGDSALLNRVTICVRDRQLDQAEVEGVSSRPDYSGDAGGSQIQLGDLFLRIAVVKPGNSLGGSVESGLGDVVIDPAQRVQLELIHFGEGLSQVRSDGEPAVVAHSAYVPKQHNSVTSELMQVQALTAVLAGNLCVRFKLIARRF